MEVTNIEEYGYDRAIKGMSMSHMDEAVNMEEWWTIQEPKARKRAVLLAVKTPEHSKFLRQIWIWADVKATRAFWQEFDTYTVGCTRLSASTMHKLSKRMPTFDDFSDTTPAEVIITFQRVWRDFKEERIDFMALKDSLPEGYLQTRGINLNYATLRNIIVQRKGHRYKYWWEFIEQLTAGIEHLELIEDLFGE
jgi:hypothetical protein